MTRAEPESENVLEEDPRLVARLWGPRDAHRRFLENQLGVRVGARGGQISLHGPPDKVDFARRALTHLLEKLTDGAPLVLHDIEREVRLLRDGAEVAAGAEAEQGVGGTVVRTQDGRKIRARTKAQSEYLDAIAAADLVFGVGPAGTGKTYLAMAAAVAALKRHEVKRILLARPAVEAGEKLGFLPGSLAEKVNPYLRPLYDALYDMMDVDRATRLVENGTIEVAPLAFMRGRTLNSAFVILDEAQNTTREQMKMFLTRLGNESKAVVTGDITQIDLPGDRESGLSHALRVLDGVEGIRSVRFTHVDVVRHPLVQRIIRAYDDAPEAG